jgi:hypothetical protein
MLEAGLQHLITSTNEFTTVAGSRLFPLLLPDNPALPSATYQRITATPLYALDGRIQFTEARIQFDTWAADYGQAKQLMDAINTAIDNFSGQLSDGTKVFGIQLDTCTDLYEESARIYRCSADYLIQYAG